MPVFDPGPIAVSVSRPVLSSLLGKGFADEQSTNRIRDQLCGQIVEPFAAYRKLMREWTKTVIDQIGTRFETYAERYRALAERTTGGEEMAAEEIQAVKKELEMLESQETGEERSEPENK